jgi:hypothetical protein
MSRVCLPCYRQWKKDDAAIALLADCPKCEVPAGATGKRMSAHVVRVEASHDLYDGDHYKALNVATQRKAPWWRLKKIREIKAAGTMDEETLRLTLKKIERLVAAGRESEAGEYMTKVSAEVKGSAEKTP